jgi:hypothetical protein
MTLTLSDLPDDILLDISMFLGPDDYFSLSCTSRQFLFLLQSNILGVIAHWKDSTVCCIDFEDFLRGASVPPFQNSICYYRYIRTLYEDFVDMANDVILLYGGQTFAGIHNLPAPLPVPRSLPLALSSCIRFWTLFNISLSYSDSELRSKMKTAYTETECNYICVVGDLLYHWVRATVQTWQIDCECYLRTPVRKPVQGNSRFTSV